MRILFCDYEYPPLGGGGGVVNALIAEELAARHEVTVLTSRPSDYPAETIENGVRLVRVPILMRKQRAAAGLVSMLTFLLTGRHAGRRLLRTQPFDVINTYFVLPTGPVGNSLSQFADIPNVLSVLGGDIYDPSKFLSPHRHYALRAIVRHLLRKADVVVGESNNILSYMRQFYTPEIAGRLIPLGIRRPPSDCGNRTAFGIAETDLIMTTVGRLVARKAIDQLLAMMSTLGNPRAHLIVMGNGPEEKKLKRLAQTLDVAHYVHFTGHVSEQEKFRVLKMSDVFVSTSQHEGFGLVFLEAMASGLPIICYNNGGQTDFLENGKTGFLPKLNDFDGFAESCGILLQNAQLRNDMGARNLNIVENFYVDKCAARYEALFEEVIQIRKTRQL